MFTTRLKTVNTRLWWSLHRKVSLFNVTRKKNLKKVSFSITEGHDSISTTNGLFVCGSCLHFESSFVCQSSCPPFPQRTSHIFLKVFLIQCSVIRNSFTTVSPDLLLNTFLLLPVYQVPSTCASRDL